MILKKALLLIICIISVLVTASCKSAAPTTAKEELVLHQWKIMDSFEHEQGIVFFENGKMNINAKLADENFKFSDEYILDDEKIIINSKEYGVLNIGYNVSGENLELEYFGKKITLKKK